MEQDEALSRLPPALPIALVEQRLSNQELAAYQAYVAAKRRPLAPDRVAHFFELFLTGSTCEDIYRLQRGSLPLGIIVQACIEHRWFERRDEHIDVLESNVKARVLQTQMEGVNFAADIMAVAHKRFGDRLKRYLMSGDEKELEGLEFLAGSSVKSYKEVVELLLKMTGQDPKPQEKKVSGEIKLTQTGPPSSRVSPATAAEIVRKLDEE